MHSGMLACLGAVRVAWLPCLALCLWLCGCATPQRVAAPGAEAVLLVSIDALPANRLGDGSLPTLDRLAADGVRADWMRPSYPTLTFPNHYTLVTGLRPDRHGIVHNKMRDPALGRYESKLASGKDGRWYGGTPIWSTLQAQGGRAATMFWPGSEAEIAGLRPYYWRPYDKTVSASARVDQVLTWLDLPAERRPRLITLYFDQYDIAAHAAGMDSAQAVEALRTLDAALSRLVDGLRSRGLRERVDLIVLSDHGIADTRIDQLAYLDDVLAPEAYEVEYAGISAGLHPGPGRTQEVERAFLGRHPHYACWRKAELPAAWHYGTHPRIPPILCQPEPGWRVQPRAAPQQSVPVKGEHGYASDAPEMRAVFVADGPDFASGRRIAAFDNVDVYPLLARLLGVPAQPNDGSLSVLRDALRDEAR